jgi:hypothetical protein
MVSPVPPHNPMSPQELNIYELWRSVGVLVGFQITVLGWRIAREQTFAKERTQIRFPIADYFNLGSITISMISIFILPIVGEWPRLRMALLGVSFLLFTAFPFALVGHYEIFRPNDHPEALTYWPRQEKIVTCIAAAVILAFLVWYICSVIHRPGP